MTPEPHNAHIAAWWADETGRSEQSGLEQQISLMLRDEFLTFFDAHLDAGLGERAEGPIGILATPDVDFSKIKVMRYAGVPSYDGVDYPGITAEIARRQREDGNERAVAWWRHATGRATSGGVLLTPEVIEQAVREAEAGYPLSRLKSRRHDRTD